MIKSRLASLLVRVAGWRLWLFLALFTILGAELVVSAMSLLLKGEILGDYLLTGLVAAGVVAPASLFIFDSLLAEISLQRRQLLEQGLDSAQARLRVALDSSDEGVLMVDAGGRVLSANKRFLELWQVPAELAAKNDDSLLLAHVLDQLEDPESFLDGVQRLYRSDEEATDTLRFRDGRVYERFTRGLVLGAEQGRIWCFRDVSEQARTREALAEREELYRAIFSQAGDGIGLIDAESTRLVEVNESKCRLLGYRREELIGQPLALIQADLDDGQIRAAIARISEAGSATFETLYRRRDGSTVEAQVSTTAIRVKGRDCVVAIARDIGERKRAQAELEESRNLLQSVIDAAPVRVFWKDRRSTYLGCNPAFARDAGKAGPEEVIGRDDSQMGWAEQAELYQADDRAVMESGTPRLSYEEPQTTPAGTTIWLSTSKVPLRGGDGAVIGVLGIYEDVTERKRMADELRQREQYRRALLDNFPFMVWLKDEESRFLAVNQAFAETFGWPSPESLIGRSDLDITTPDLAAGYRADDRAVLAGGRSKQVEEIVEVRGQPRWFETYKSPVALGGKVIGTVGFGRDITERKETENRLRLQAMVLDQIHDRVTVTDLDGRITYVNRAELAGLGRDAADFLGHDVEVFGDDPRADAAQAEIVRQTRETGAWQGQVINFDSDGAARTIDLRTTLVRDDAGKPVAMVGIGADITERVRAERNLKLAVGVASVVPWELDLASQRITYDLSTLPLLGLPEDASLTTLPGWLARIHPDEAAEFVRRFEAALVPGAADFEMEYRLLAGDGAYEWIGTRGGVIQRAPDGQPEVAVGTSMNVTARKRIEAELHRHREHLEELVREKTGALLATEARASRILESTADGLYGVDLDGRISFINPAACRMLGYRAEEAIGRIAHDLFHHSHPDGTPFPAAECEARQIWRAGMEARVDDATYWHADGRPLPVALAAHPMLEGGRVVGAVVSVVDTRAQRAAAAAREQALQAAEDLARARSQFLANMSHEIRTPMNGMLGFAQIGLRHCTEPQRAHAAFEKILASGNRLLRVVDDILDFSKIDAGKLGIEEVDMVPARVIREAVELVAERARAKGIELRSDLAPDLPLSCIGDPLRVGQVLTNLLSNAVKFTERGRIVLAAAREGEQLVFRVSDSGIGMTAEHLAEAFNPFQQADGSTTRRFGGTGLGLAICSRLVELMHGSIRVTSEPGVGSEFEVRLPYRAAQEPAPGPARPAAEGTTAPAGQPLRGVRILLAEDDEVSRQMLESALALMGAEVTSAVDGREAVARIGADGAAACDIVLMDIQMPEMDGYEATRRIHEIHPGLPVIAQTAHALDDERERCLAAGMVDHLAKPVDLAALVEAVRRFVPGSRDG